MSVETVFETVCRELPSAGVEFLMIGGHAVNHYGYIRATMDVDFMITAEAVSSVREVMRNSGFTNVSEGENVIFFSRPDSPIRVDFLPVDAETMKTLLQNAVAVDYGGFPVRVPSLTDLIAMKLFALRNPKREARDSADIVQLVLENDLNAETDLKPLCSRFATNEIYRKLLFQIEETNHA